MNTILFADDQIILADSEQDLQRAVFQLKEVTKHFNLEVSTQKSKVMAFKGKYPIRSKIALNEIVKQVSCFNYLGCIVSYEHKKVSTIK